MLKAYCQWNGQKGTPKQMAQVRCSDEVLERLLAERGISVTARYEVVA
jgi:ribosomal protein S12 methylthiotransferase accessory factor YcaO